MSLIDLLENYSYLKEPCAKQTNKQANKQTNKQKQQQKKCRYECTIKAIPYPLKIRKAYNNSRQVDMLVKSINQQSEETTLLVICSQTC